MLFPLVQQIRYQNHLAVFNQFAEQHGAVLLDSAELREYSGRYSFIAIDPFYVLSSKNGLINENGQVFQGNPFDVLAAALKNFQCANHPELPPFQGGAAGFFSYDLYQHLETIPRHREDDMQFPDLAIGFYDLVMAFDHVQQAAWIFSNGFPYQDSPEREQHAEKRLQWLIDTSSRGLSAGSRAAFSTAESHSGFRGQAAGRREIKANFTPEEYQTAVQKVIDYILAGDVFETCISQRFKAELPSHVSEYDLYCLLRSLNPAPFASYLKLADTVIVSASPERFLKLSAGAVETRPIKGTRPRGKTQQEDEQLANELIHSEKDNAENVMIVDLLRNDLSRVCEDHSVNVPQLCGLESYPAVHHLVSVVQAKLKPSFNAIDLLKAAFPGGSITGAPKIRSMEIIAEIEPTQRGPYCGSIGYIGFNGDMDTSIVIRTYAIKNHVVTFQAGGAIVADSNPFDEYEETLTKAKALRRALTR